LVDANETIGLRSVYVRKCKKQLQKIHYASKLNFKDSMGTLSFYSVFVTGELRSAADFTLESNSTAFSYF